MVVIEDLEVTGWKSAVVGSRLSYNSMNKSDSRVCSGRCSDCADCTMKWGDKECEVPLIGSYVLGKRDLGLLHRLSNAGADSHALGIRMIDAHFTLTASLELWKQLDRYRIGVEKASASTMHNVMDKPFYLSDFSCENALTLGVKGMQTIVDMLNKARDIYINWDKYKDSLEPKGITKDAVWNSVVEMLPESYMQTRRMKCSYLALKHIYNDRKTHKLRDWHIICEWIESLPYAKELIVCK